MMATRFSTFWQSPGGVLLPEFVQVLELANAGAATTHTNAYTCAVSPGANRLLIYAIAARRSSDPTSWEAVTYNGTAMALVAWVRNASPTPDNVSAIYQLLHSDIPNDGASHNFFVDFDSTNTSTLVSAAVEYINIKQDVPHRTGTQATSTATPSINLTTVAANSLVLDCLSGTGVETVTPAGSQHDRAFAAQTSRLQQVSDLLPADHAGGTVNMGHTIGASQAVAYVAAAWEAAA